MKEIISAVTCVDNFSGRGMNIAEVDLPNLLTDIKETIYPICRVDPTFCAPNLYRPLGFRHKAGQF